MTSIWFFVALAVALVAVNLLRHRHVAREHRNDGHDVKASRGNRGSGCCR